MIGWERRVLLRHYVEQGMTKTELELAERFGISRQTIHRWIREGELDRDLAADMVRYGPRSPVPTRLDPYKDIIVSRLGEFPRLTAVRLFDEMKRAGYPGGYTQVKEYVREIRPRPPEEPVVRFETAPGHQGQVDFADFRLPWGKRYALLVVLGYSRLMWVQYYRRKTMRNVFDGLERAFAFFGGVPRELLFDQMKAVIEVDETMIGGKRTGENWRDNKHWVAGATERGGRVRIERIPNVRRDTLHGFIRRTVRDEAEAIYTDDLKSYIGIADDDTRHQTVNHSAEEWVVGDVYTNSIEGVWSLFKRSIVGSFHKMSAKHMDRYLEELEWRYNNRDNPHIFRDTLARIMNTDPLRYSELVA